MSPERVRNMLNKLPPFPADKIPEEDIDAFQVKGTIGWNYLTQQLLNGSDVLDEKVQQLLTEKEERQKRKQRAQSQATIKSVTSTIEHDTIQKEETNRLNSPPRSRDTTSKINPIRIGGHHAHEKAHEMEAHKAAVQRRTVLKSKAQDR